jgi:hypothetical protein
MNVQHFPREYVEHPERYLLYEFQSVHGRFEPWYLTVSEFEMNNVVWARWMCPHCQLLFCSRSACERHCKGKEGSFPPPCPALKK